MVSNFSIDIYGLSEHYSQMSTLLFFFWRIGVVKFPSDMANMNYLSKNIRFSRYLTNIWSQTPSRTLTSSQVLLRQVHVLSVVNPDSSKQGLRQPLFTSGSVFQIAPFRSYHDHLEQQPAQNNEKEENFEEHEQTIYKGILATQIKLVKSFSLMTSVIGLACQPVLFLKMGAGSANLPLIIASGAFLSFFTFATPLLIHWVSKKYVVELVYNKIDDTYTAITYSLLLRKKEVITAAYQALHKVALCFSLSIRSK